MLDSMTDVPLGFKTPGPQAYTMAGNNDPPSMPDDEMARICDGLGIKATKKNRILVTRLVKQVGTDMKKLVIAYKKATILS